MTEGDGASDRRARDPAERPFAVLRGARSASSTELSPALRPSAWQDVLELLPQPVFVLGVDRRLRWINAAGLAALDAVRDAGSDADDVDTFEVILRGVFGPDAADAPLAPADGPPWTAPRECLLGARWFDAAARRADDAAGAGLVVVTLADVTARREAHAQLAREQAERARADDAVRARDEFLATVSHELRTPLNAMLGWSRTLRDETGDPARRARALAALERNVAMQTRLVEDLLDAARIAAGKLHVEHAPLALVPIVDAALEVARPAADAKGVQLDAALTPPAAPIVGDGQRLQQLVWNLLSNAVKFTPPGGRVELTLSAAPSVDHRECFEWFECFECFGRCGRRPRRAGHRPRDHPRGAALYLRALPPGGPRDDPDARRPRARPRDRAAHRRAARRLARGRERGRRPGVDLHALSAVQRARGARAPDRSNTTPEGESDPRCAPVLQRLAGVRVLAVDDDDDGRELLGTFLAAEGAQVTVAASGAEALALFERTRPDVLVCDIGMPGMDGFALLRTIRARGASRGGMVPAVALTGYASADDTRQALLAGFQLHIAKPVDPDALVAKIEKLVARSSGGA